MNGELHSSWTDDPVSWLPQNGATSYAEQLINHSVNAAIGPALDEIPPGSSFPWGFIEVKPDLLRDLSRGTALPIEKYLRMLGPDLVTAIRENRVDSDQRCLHLNLKSLNPHVLRVLATGMDIDGEAVVHGIHHGQTIPPWKRAGPDAPVVDQFAKCLQGLASYEPIEFSAEPVPVIAMAWAAYAEPTVLCAIANISHPRVHDGVLTSAICVAHESMHRVKREAQARETWKMCRELSNAVLKLTEIQIPGHARREINWLIEDEHPNPENVHRVIRVTENLIKPAWRQHLEETKLYPIIWNTRWGQYPCKLLNALRNASTKGIKTSFLHEMLGRDPAKIIQEMCISKRKDKAKLGKYLKQLREKHNDGKYFLY